MEHYDLIIIGSGPGGYVASIRAAQRGLKVACIEKEETLGGTCLNVGCIPSKALLHSTEYYHRIAAEGKIHGIEVEGLRIDLARLMQRKEKIVESLVQGIDFLFKKNKVNSIKGEAILTSETTVQVGNQALKGGHILLATGSEPIGLPFLPFDEKRILSSTGALALTKVPSKLLVIGAGVIGLELGSVYLRLGSEVEVIELLDRITPAFDFEISKMTQKILTKQGMRFSLNRKIEPGEDLQGEAILVAIGRKPYSKGLGLEKVGVEMDKQGRVKIDGSFRTSVPTILAIGDLVDGPMLAHKASEEGVACVDLLCGDKLELNYLAIPNVMYTWPEVACVGMTEEEARAAHLTIRIGKVPFKAIPRARCSGDEEGMVKLIAETTSDRLIGLHIVGPNASEMIHEGVIALKKGMTVLELAHTSHAHPTCSEAIKEAALSAHKQAIHLIN